MNTQEYLPFGYISLIIHLKPHIFYKYFQTKSF